jgi:nucleoside-diphosphate-sugar epimerase
MNVFVTGATGYVGSAVVRALVGRGHRVTGLSRSPEKDAALKALGGEPLRGALLDLPRLEQALAACDALVHAAMDYGLGPAADRAAVEALLEAARSARAPRVVVYTSGVWVLGETATPAGEDASVARPAAAVAWRPAHEKLVLDAAGGDLATAVVRPGIVWGERRGLVSGFLETATQEGAAAVVGSGQNRWPLAHREDLAELYRLVVERRARGVYHGVDGSAPRVADIARALAEAAGKKGATRSIPVEEARKTMGPMADALAMDQVVVAPRSAELGWKPARPAFPGAAGAAFAEWKA